MAESSPDPERPPSESAQARTGSAASEAVSASGPASRLMRRRSRSRQRSWSSKTATGARSPISRTSESGVLGTSSGAATDERAGTAAAWLPVLDNLERALAPRRLRPGAVLQGIRAVRDQALQVLAQLGFPRRDDVGAPFDPSRHEAVSVVATDRVPEGTIIEVVRPGYGDDEHQLRPAAVVVAKRAD